MARRPPIVVRGGTTQTVRSRQQAGTSITQESPKVSVVGGSQGIAGKDGGDADFVWPIKPDATFSYDADGLVSRIDYADATFKVFAYDGNELLLTVSGENTGGETVTVTHGYDSQERITSVTTVVTP